MIVQGNALSVLRDWPDEFFNCIVTSPPYWGLRDYGTDPLVWGGDKDCEHEWGVDLPCHHPGQVEQSKWSKADGAGKGQTKSSGQYCTKCGAWLGQLGLEPTFQEYIAHLIEIFNEAKRVLTKDGTCWVNLGDTYSTHGGSKNTNHSHNFRSAEVSHEQGIYKPKPSHIKQGLSEKSLCQIPSRFAIAMTDNGWILRNEIIWFKRNCMPSSAKDRFTVDFEKLFFFTKSKKYWFEQQKEPAEQNRWGKHNPINLNNTKDTDNQFAGLSRERDMMPEERNKRCVWDIPTKPYKGAHFAVFPDTLVEPVLAAGCPVEGWVCDPLAGSGTVGVVAERQGKNFVGIEINPAYIELAEKRGVT